jgi:hypothetical protein
LSTLANSLPMTALLFICTSRPQGLSPECYSIIIELEFEAGVKIG